MYSIEAGNFQRFIASGVDTPTSLNLINEIGSVVVSGLPVNTASGLYYADYTFSENFYPGVYFTDWQPKNDILSGLDHIFVFRNDYYVIQSTYGKTGYKRTTPAPLSSLFNCTNSGLIPDYPYVTHWLFDYYTYTPAIKSTLLTYNPTAKIGISIPAQIDPRWEQDFYHSFGILLSGSQSDWENYFDQILFENPDLDFYLISGVTDNRYSSWASTRDDLIFLSSTSSVYYDNIVYFTNSLNEASKIVASGMYLFTDDYNVAGRLACGYYGVVSGLKNLVYTSLAKTVYDDGSEFI